MDYVSRENTPNLYRIGEPYRLPISHYTPGITAKGLSIVYLGQEQNFCHFNLYYDYMDTKPKVLWDKMEGCNSKMILGMQISDYFLDKKAFNGVFFTMEARSPIPIIHPQDLAAKLNVPFVKKLTLKRTDENNLELLREYSQGSRNLYHKIISMYDYFDLTMVVFHMDRYTHVETGPNLLNEYIDCDRELGNIIDMIETKNIIAFAEHGADHRREALVAYNLEDQVLNNRKLTHFNELHNFILEAWRNIK